MPLQTGFLFSFPVAYIPQKRPHLLESYPLRADGYFSKNSFSLPLLLKSPAVQNLSPAYYEVVQHSLNILEKLTIYNEFLLNESSHLVFSYKDTPILVFENVSIANSDWISKIDLSWLVPHWISDEQSKQRQLGEKRLAVLGILTLFMSVGLLKNWRPWRV